MQVNAHTIQNIKWSLILPYRSISALIGIPNAAMLELTNSPLEDLNPCIKIENVIFDLAHCAPTWPEDVDFGVLLIKVGGKSTL